MPEPEVFSLQALRSLEGNEAQVCFFIIQILLLKPSDFRSRVQEFVEEVSAMISSWVTKVISLIMLSNVFILLGATVVGGGELAQLVRVRGL